MPFIIDGYNLLREIEKDEESDGLIDDIGLCHLLGRYFKLIRQKGQMIFDGNGPLEKSAFYGISGHAINVKRRGGRQVRIDNDCAYLHPRSICCDSRGKSHNVSVGGPGVGSVYKHSAINLCRGYGMSKFRPGENVINLPRRTWACNTQNSYLNDG